jgi:hypothetical protein
MILRTKFTDGYEVNQDLGSEYHLVRKETCPSKFSESAEIVFGKNINDFISGTIAFVVYGDGKHVVPIYGNQDNYILNNDGKLFQALTS